MATNDPSEPDLSPYWFAVLLGTFSLASIRGHTLHRLGTHKNDALLAYLLLHPQRRHSREVLTEIFWPDAPEPERARHSLSVAIAALRSLLEKEANGLVLDVDRTFLSIYPGKIVTDVARFEALLEKGDMMTAVSLYGGPLLPGWEEDWVSRERDRLRDEFLRAVYDLIRREEAEENWEEALRWERAGLQRDPTNPDLIVALLERLLGLGRAEEAQQMAQMLLSRLVAERAPIPEALWRQLGLPKRPALSIRPADASPLAPPLGGMMGREKEAGHLITLFEKGARLITLTGGIGVGKSVLAQVVAHRLDQGGWRVLLTHSDRVTGAGSKAPACTLLAALGVQFSEDEDVTMCDARAERELSGGPTLLILEDAERWVKDVWADWIDGMLRRAPRLAVLVVSRSRGDLSVRADEVMRLEPFTIPHNGEAEDFLGAPALNLFARRAQAAFPGFTLSADDHSDLLRLIRQMDGVPLLIEMAARCTSVLTPSELSYALAEGNIGLLHASEATAVNKTLRHGSLADSLRVSWQELSRNARHLLLALADGAEGDILSGSCAEELQDAALALPDDTGRLRCAERVHLFLAGGYSFSEENSNPC